MYLPNIGCDRSGISAGILLGFLRVQNEVSGYGADIGRTKSGLLIKTADAKFGYMLIVQIGVTEIYLQNKVTILSLTTCAYTKNMLVQERFAWMYHPGFDVWCLPWRTLIQESLYEEILLHPALRSVMCGYFFRRPGRGRNR
jgi:hypothetical protein